MRTQDQWWCSCGEHPHCSLTKNSSALRLCIPVMLGKSSHHEKSWVFMTTFEFFKKIQPTPSFYLFQNRCPSPFGWLPWIVSYWGQGIPWTKRESDGLGLFIHLTKGRDDLVMHCSQSLAHYGGCFWKEKERGIGEGGYFDKLKNGGRDPIFLWWELIPTIPGMQSLKALLFFVKEQCRFLPSLHHHRSCVLIP